MKAKIQTNQISETSFHNSAFYFRTKFVVEIKQKMGSKIFVALSLLISRMSWTKILLNQSDLFFD